MFFGGRLNKGGGAREARMPQPIPGTPMIGAQMAERAGVTPPMPAGNGGPMQQPGPMPAPMLGTPMVGAQMAANAAPPEATLPVAPQRTGGIGRMVGPQNGMGQQLRNMFFSKGGGTRPMPQPNPYEWGPR